VCVMGESDMNVYERPIRVYACVMCESDMSMCVRAI